MTLEIIESYKRKDFKKFKLLPTPFFKLLRLKTLQQYSYEQLLSLFLEVSLFFFSAGKRKRDRATQKMTLLDSSFDHVLSYRR